MEKNKEKLINELIEKIGELPPNGQKAVVFVIENFDLIKKMCENSGLSENELDKQMKKAQETDDYVLLALSAAARVFTDYKE